MRRLAAAVIFLAACGGDDDDVSGQDGGSPDGSAGGGSWEQLADLPSGPVQETAVVELGGLIYVIGGIDEEGTTLDQVLVYDPARDAWDAAPSLISPCHHVNAAVVAGTIYVVGSLAPNFDARADVWSWKPGDNSWSADHPFMPAARGASAVGVLDGRILVAGGFDVTSVASVVIYDPGTDEFDTTPTELPLPLDHATGQVVDGSFYIIGGRSNGIEAVSAAVFRYEDATWNERVSMPTARGGVASGVVNGRIVVVGGEGNTDAASGVFPQAEVYDPAANTWESLPDMPTPRHGMAAAGLGDALYVPGGADHQGFGAVATHEVLHLD